LWQAICTFKYFSKQAEGKANICHKLLLQLVHHCEQWSCVGIGGKIFNSSKSYNSIKIENKPQLKSRLLGIFGSYGWSGGGVKGIAEFAKKVDWEIVEPIVEARFSPNIDDLNQCEKLARNLAQRLGIA
jgi:hypothetical protein